MMILFAVLLTSEGLVKSEEAEGRLCKLLQHDLLLGLLFFEGWVLNSDPLLYEAKQFL